MISSAGTAIVHAQTCPTEVVDDRVMHIGRAADVVSVRQSLYQYIWGQNTLPSDSSVTVTPNAVSPIQCSADLARVDAFTLSIPVQAGGSVELNDGSTLTSILGTAWHFVPTNPRNKLAIVHQGHLDVDQMDEGPYSGLCDKALSGGEDDLHYYGVQTMINALLADGYDVLAVLMPLYVPGQCKGFQHGALFAPNALPAGGGSGVRYFLDMTLHSVNYLLSTNSFSEVSMTGLSGGGWTTTIYAALDPRVSKNFPVAGTLPLYLRDATLLPQDFQSSQISSFVVCGDVGDEEQFHTDLYSIAGYLDLYVLGSYGPGREQTQILNRNDNCCFGAGQHDDPDNYDGDLRSYEETVRSTLQKIGAGSFTLRIDEAAVQHQISRDAVHNVILASLDGAHPRLGADSASQAFKRGDNGHLWGTGVSGWQDLGFRISGHPSVLEGSTYPTQVAVRNALNEPELVYKNGSQWQKLALPNASLPHQTYGTGKIIADPVIAAAATGELDVVAQGTDFGFYRWHVTSGGPSYSAIGGSTYSVGTPSVSRTTAGALTVTYRSGELTDPQTACIEQPRILYSVSQNSSGVWQPEQRLGGSGGLGITPAFPASINDGSSQLAFYLDQTGAMWQYANTGGQSQWTMVSSGAVDLAGSSSRVIQQTGLGLYVRTVDGDLNRFVYNGAWTSAGLALDPDGNDAVVDSPMNTAGGVYWTARDGDARFYNGTTMTVLNVVDTIFREDFEGALGPP